MVSTPTPPDPVTTANAQATLNQDTATTQNLLNMTNQVGPSGSVTYGQTGTNSFTDATGKTVTVPQFTQTTSYSPGEQAIYDKTEAAKTNLAQLAETQSGKLNDLLDKPFSFTNNDAANYTTDLASQRILPQQAQARADLDTRLVNAGIRPGTAAYDREMTTLDHSNTDQLNQLALSSQSQAYNQALQTYNEPINAITGLTSGSQIAAPNAGTSATPQASVGGVDYSGLVQSNYAQQVASSNALMGGLFGLAGAGGAAAITKYSDARVKRDISRVGTLENGLPVYSYRYAWGGPVEIGLIAQDVERFRPDAVHEIGGIKAVDYRMATA